jgi:tRNA pseudouridine32 synthase / 23S rRNA pseudouridine746 synthase
MARELMGGLSGHPASADEQLVLHADEHLLVLNKPSGMLCVPGRGDDKQDCLSLRVQRLYPDALVVHRLDMATSGLCLMARGARMQRLLSVAFAQREVTKRYVAVVAGRLATAYSGTEEWALIDLPIAADWPNRPLRVIDAQSGKPSRTRWRVLSHDAEADTTRVACRARTHHRPFASTAPASAGYRPSHPRRRMVRDARDPFSQQPASAACH